VPCVLYIYVLAKASYMTPWDENGLENPIAFLSR